MESESALVISRSTLMHTSLALSSNSLKTLDSIVNSHHKSLTGYSFPMEILLLIRAYLLVYVTDSLILRSSSALQRYETSLRYLLCPDCRGYNRSVYGGDVWKWEQFSGACTCFATRHRSISSPISLWRRDSQIPVSSSPPALNPRRFVSRQHWLEFYLSMKALRLKQGRRFSDDQQPVIWDLVSDVLDIYGCQRVQARDHCQENVVIVPHGSFFDIEEASIALNRIRRDLALSMEYNLQPAVETTPFHSMLHRRFSLHYKSRTAASEYDENSGLLRLVDSVQSVFLAALFLPMSIMMLVLAIFCFYSRPRAFRIL
ncbi:hypothetical protein GYMLUDRAFT_278437 [Collybiopsis luxurians FD-317 M1]|nr:hypothetical protein GYMLUDRAFT_278437 [Collybiopsis luxurians FD-317 M1]